MSAIDTRRMPDGYAYDIRRGGMGWEARRQHRGWMTAKSAAFALIRASGGDVEDPEEFGEVARAWEYELRHGASQRLCEVCGHIVHSMADVEACHLCRAAGGEFVARWLNTMLDGGALWDDAALVVDVEQLEPPATRAA